MSTTSTSRRKSRVVTFEAERYRWVVSDAAAGARLFVRRDVGTGMRLEVPLMREEEGLYWFPGGSKGPGPVTPNIVIALMTTARQLGWIPNARGGVFELRLTSAERNVVDGQREPR